MYISSHVDCAISGGLASASFWVFVIQDIQFALTYQKCLRLTFAPFDDRLRQWWVAKPVLSVGDWVNRAIWLLAETIDFCYNVSGRNYGGHLGVVGETALKHRIREWETTRPDPFVPLHVSPPEPGHGKPFPVVWYTSLWHCKISIPSGCLGSILTFRSLLAATAMQHICLAKALMLIREMEVYERSLSSDRRVKIKVGSTIDDVMTFDLHLAGTNHGESQLSLWHCLVRR